MADENSFHRVLSIVRGARVMQISSWAVTNSPPRHVSDCGNPGSFPSVLSSRRAVSQGAASVRGHARASRVRLNHLRDGQLSFTAKLVEGKKRLRVPSHSRDCACSNRPWATNLETAPATGWLLITSPSSGVRGVGWYSPTAIPTLGGSYDSRKGCRWVLILCPLAQWCLCLVQIIVNAAPTR